MRCAGQDQDERGGETARTRHTGRGQPHAQRVAGEIADEDPDADRWARRGLPERQRVHHLRVGDPPRGEPLLLAARSTAYAPPNETRPTLRKKSDTARSRSSARTRGLRLATGEQRRGAPSPPSPGAPASGGWTPPRSREAEARTPRAEAPRRRRRSPPGSLKRRPQRSLAQPEHRRDQQGERHRTESREHAQQLGPVPEADIERRQRGQGDDAGGDEERPARIPPRTPRTRQPMRMAICEARARAARGRSSAPGRTRRRRASAAARHTSSCISPSCAPARRTPASRYGRTPGELGERDGLGRHAGRRTIARIAPTVPIPCDSPEASPPWRSMGGSMTFRKRWWMLVPLAAALGCAGSQQAQRETKSGGKSTLVDEGPASASAQNAPNAAEAGAAGQAASGQLSPSGYERSPS